jgi:hypothetical protein
LGATAQGRITFICIFQSLDVVEFFNLIQELKLTKQEKADMVAFLRAL